MEQLKQEKAMKAALSFIMSHAVYGAHPKIPDQRKSDKVLQPKIKTPPLCVAVRKIR